MHLMDLIHQKIELFRLEQRYTRRRNRRSTFVSEAQYVDGEYIYSPTSSYSAKCSAGNTSDSDEQLESQQSPSPSPTSASSAGSKGSVGRTGRASKRLSMMALGDKMDWRKGKDEKNRERSNVVISEREVKWDDSIRR